jgi:hypothetical protein
VVEERSKRVEAKDVSHGGEFGSEYVGTSSTYPDESSGRRKPKVSRATRIVPGLVDPKASPLQGGVTDGRAGQYSCTW